MGKGMKGLDLAREFYAACRQALEDAAPGAMARAAAGLVGEGSECFGLDDGISRDHDFGPAFCLWLPEDLEPAEKKKLKEAVARLPADFMGMPSRFGRPGGRIGPMGIREFYASLTGLDRPPASNYEWLAIPECQLAAATNGEIFEDREGAFTAWRKALLGYYPRDVWLKKLAAAAMNMAQAGQYNLPRSLARGNGAAAMLAAARFAESALAMVFLLNRRYMPFYKQAPALAGPLPELGAEIRALLDSLAAHPLRDGRDMGAAEMIEEFCGACAAALRLRGLSDQPDSWLWAHGPAIISLVNDKNLKNSNLLDFGHE